MNTKNVYQWKIESLAKKVDVYKAVNEFERVEKEFGKLTPKNVVEASRPKKAVLHSIIFEIEDFKAAEKYRQQLARNIINNVDVQIITDSGVHAISNYEIVVIKDIGRQYKSIETLTFDEIEQVRNSTLSILKQASHKLKMYKEFDKVLDYLNKAVELLVE